jgi:hypothetical protein
MRYVTRNLGIFKQQLEWGGGGGNQGTMLLLFEEMGAHKEDLKDSIFV